MESHSEALSQRPGVLRAVLGALKGEHRDYTEGNLTQSLWLLAIPMVMEMLMESIFAVVDVFVVGRLGSEAVATVGLTESMLTLLYAVAAGLSIGAMALVARRTGEKDPEGASRVAAQALFLGVGIAIPVGLAGAFFAPELLKLMGASGWVLENGHLYTRVMLASSVSITLLFLINAIFRGSGDPAIAMRTLWLANGINVVLAPCLVLGLGPFPSMGVLGAAIATTIGRTSGVLFQLYTLFSGKSRVTLARRHLRVETKTLIGMLQLSGSGVLQALIGMTSWVALMRIISSFGTAAIAGYTIAIRIVLFALLPSWGMSNAAATLVGQSLGAKKPERAEKAVWLGGMNNAAFLGAVAVIFLFFADPIVARFAGDPETAAHAGRGLRILAAGFLFYAYGMVLTSAFNGAGDARTPTLVNLFCFWILELPLAWVLAHVVGLGPTGVYLAVTISFSVLAVVGALLFRRGTWKTVRV